MSTEIILSLGSNLEDRFASLKSAIEKLSEIMSIEKESVVFETEAILPENAPAEWNRPYLNMVLRGKTDLKVEDFFVKSKEFETQLGRQQIGKWGPRIVDIDILYYGNKIISTKNLTIPHKQIPNRVFLKSLLNIIGFKFNDEETNDYTPLDSFVLKPNFVGIVNVTPDSFSDGGQYFNTEDALERIERLRKIGTDVIELGAQSTRPGYEEIPPQEELKRLLAVMENLTNFSHIGIDSYFDDVIKPVINKFDIKWVNDQNGVLKKTTLKILVDRDIKYVTMLHGTNVLWLKERIRFLREVGFKNENIIIDPGIGFGKTKFENIGFIKTIKDLKDFGCKIMLGHSRKSFLSTFTNAEPKDRDIETLAVSNFAIKNGVDYLRVHNVEMHKKFLVAQKIIADC